MLDVLAVGPHPDDLELAAGGTLAKLARAGRSVGMLDLTAGERGTRGTPEIRRREAEEAARHLGVEFRECLGLPDGGLSRYEPAHLAAVVAALRTRRPRIVVTMHGDDDHPDHVEGAALVERAAYVAGLKNASGADGEPHRPRAVLFAMGRRGFVPGVVVDVTGSYEAKRRALAAYRSQFFRDPDDPLVTSISEPGFLDRVEARDRYHGGMVGAEFGEPFFLRGPVPGGLFEPWLEERQE